MKPLSPVVAFIVDITTEYAPPLIAVIVGVIYAVNPKAFDVNQLLVAMLAILVFASAGAFKRSLQLRKIEKTTKENYDLTLREFGETAKARNFFLKDSDLLNYLSNDRLDGAKQIFLSGMSLHRTIRTLQPILEHKITVGGQVKIIILDSTNITLMQELFSRSAGARTAEGWQEALRGTREDIQTIVGGLPKQGKGSLEIGYLPYIPSFGMALINPKVRSGNDKACYVELYHHRSTLRNPTFVIKQDDDEHWYRFFVSQYDLLWKSCEKTEKLF